MARAIKVVLYGVGPLGARVAHAVLGRRNVEVVGAVDLQNVGTDLGTAVGAARKAGIPIRGDTDTVLRETQADIVIHATTSRLETAVPQIEACLRAGLNVITSCEELAYPVSSQRELAIRVDTLAKRQGKAVLATGINPGFLMDKLPLVLTAVCLEVSRVTVTRMMKSRVRRPSFQKKIGTGMQVEEFRQLIREGTITGHVGLVESAAMLADGLGFEVERVVELPVEPVICTREVTTYADPSEREVVRVVRPGEVAGLKSVAHAISKGKPVVVLEFVAHANVDDPYDAISIVGTPNIEQKIIGGVDGDIGTVAMLVNSMPRVLAAPPGLHTMQDINPPVPLTEKYWT
jgi:2,4-diaminopentanoate dehydrogenase